MQKNIPNVEFYSLRLFTIDDMEEYVKNRGFNFENPYMYMPGAHIKNVDGLYSFVDNLVGTLLGRNCSTNILHYFRLFIFCKTQTPHQYNQIKIQRNNHTIYFMDSIIYSTILHCTKFRVFQTLFRSA